LADKARHSRGNSSMIVRIRNLRPSRVRSWSKSFAIVARTNGAQWLTPDMVPMRRPQPDDRAVLVVGPLALLVALRKLHPLFTPRAIALDPMADQWLAARPACD
ncbi:MAG: hypothetical protein AAGP08_18930, partial [Pseudomonadota bacterium]